MKMLLVWEIVPEATNCYILDPNSEQASWARDSAGQFINATTKGEDTTNIDKLNEWLDTGEAMGCLIDEHKPIIGPFSEVVICGFVM